MNEDKINLRDYAYKTKVFHLIKDKITGKETSSGKYTL